MLDITEHQAAKQWRRRLGLSRRALSELTGYSEESIRLYEVGRKPNGEPIDPCAFQRYKLGCAAIQAGLSFDWQTATFEVTEKRAIAI